MGLWPRKQFGLLILFDSTYIGCGVYVFFLKKKLARTLFIDEDGNIVYHKGENKTRGLIVPDTIFFH
jgi:hypothetical protein